MFRGERFAALKAKGARVQRPLWASTSTKNPRYRDVLYVEELIGPDTVNTMPLGTISAFEDHGRVERSLDRDIEGATETMRALRDAGIDMKDVTDTLQAEGVTLFTASLESVYPCIQEKRERLLTERHKRSTYVMGRSG